MHPNTENSIKISTANQMFDFLLDILPLDSGEANEDDDEKKGSGENIIDTKIMFITEAIPRDKCGPDVPGRQ